MCVYACQFACVYAVEGQASRNFVVRWTVWQSVGPAEAAYTNENWITEESGDDSEEGKRVGSEVAFKWLQNPPGAFRGTSSQEGGHMRILNRVGIFHCHRTF